MGIAGKQKNENKLKNKIMKTTTTLRDYAYHIVHLALERSRMKYVPNNKHIATISGKFDFENITDEKWLRIISRNSKKQENRKGQLRFLQKLRKIATNIKRTNEYMLVSSFRNIMIDREQIAMEIIDGGKLEEYTKDPYASDYLLSSKDIAETVKMRPVYLKDDEVRDFRQKKTYYTSDEERICFSIPEREEIFSVSTHDSNRGIPICPHCKGKGFFKCEECEGSGREQYVDGYYASGEERVKTGQCSHCYGRGKIDCEVCGGARKPEIYSDKYQIIKRFKGKKIVLGYDCMSSTYGYFWNEEGGDDYYYLCNIWYQFENTEIKQCIDKLYKHQNKVITDNNGQLAQAVLEKTDQDCSNLYKKNKEAAYSHWEEEGLLKGQLGCALEYHGIVPVIRLRCTNKLNNKKFEILISQYKYYESGEIEGSGIQYTINGIQELSFLQSLFLR
jgi:hypothetical protein